MEVLTQQAVALRIGSEKGSALLTLTFQSGRVLLQALLALWRLLPAPGGGVTGGVLLQTLLALWCLLPVPCGGVAGGVLLQTLWRRLLLPSGGVTGSVSLLAL